MVLKKWNRETEGKQNWNMKKLEGKQKKSKENTSIWNLFQNHFGVFQYSQ